MDVLSAPRPLSWRRLWALTRSPYSVLRSLQYEALRDATISGRALDAGGGAKAGYNDLVPAGMESLNSDPAAEPTILADLNAPLPLPSGAYDTVITLNALEHVRHDEGAVRELIRILKPGGRLLIFVPFLYREHWSPSDFHRHPAPWWHATLTDLGCTVRIEPLVWGRLSTGYALIEPMRPVAPLRFLALLLDVILAALKPSTRQTAVRYPLGYAIGATTRA